MNENACLLGMSFECNDFLKSFACKLQLLHSLISFHGQCSNSYNDFVCICSRKDFKNPIFLQSNMILNNSSHFEILFIVKIFSEKRKLKKKRKFSNVRTLPNYTRDLSLAFKLKLGHWLAS